MVFSIAQPPYDSDPRKDELLRNIMGSIEALQIKIEEIEERLNEVEKKQTET